MNKLLAGLFGLALLQQTALAQEAPTAPLRPDQVAFRGLYRELVETNTALSVGSCTLASQRMGVHLKSAGYPDSDITLFSTPDHPREGGLVAILHGTSKTAKPILLLGHIDVVEARREDRTRDPFTLIEENGFFYGRGTSDMKAMSVTWVDAMARFKQSGFRPKRDIKLALTCGEESDAPFNGAEWLAQNHPDWISAAFALNEGGGGETDGRGKLVIQTIQVGEKIFQNYRIEAVNVGGHSSIPIRDNAIYQLSDALLKIRNYEFPIKMTDTTRTYFTRVGAARGGEIGRAMMALVKDPTDKVADAIVSTDRSYHSMLRTTCVATLLDGGHANNALPQRAGANINCRIFPTETVDQTAATLNRIIGDPGIKITAVGKITPIASPPPLDPRVVGPAEKLAAKYFSGVPVVPVMLTGATDGRYLGAVGIPTYGVPGGWHDPDMGGIHGLNERNSVRSVYVGRDYLTDLVKAYANGE
jgi:acetylornithine deacetylase/succinyl-diaminopimelate desuccinylase-like protein